MPESVGAPLSSLHAGQAELPSPRAAAALPEARIEAPSAWRACWGTVRGTEHARLHRNNQDAVAACRSGTTTAIVVCDGCSDGAFSEVGARLIARFVAERAVAAEPQQVVDSLRDWLERVSLGPHFVQEQLLATFLCAVAVGPRACIFGIGDGVWSVDGARTSLSAGPDNAPPYVAYRLLGDTVPLAIHYCGPALRVCIATDGASGLDFEEHFGWKNPYALQRRLNQTSGLADDCTLALLEHR